MSLIDKLSQGVPIAINDYIMLFIVLVLIVLAILWFIIKPKHIASTQKKSKENIMEVEEVKAVEPTQTVVEEEQVDEGELIAVLTAAVAASLNTSTYNLRIKSFKCIDTKNNVWSNASRNDAINKF